MSISSALIRNSLGRLRISQFQSIQLTAPSATATITASPSIAQRNTFSTNNTNNNKPKPINVHDPSEAAKILQYSEEISNLTNEQLSDPTTIPGFATLIHSPPRNRDTTPRNALVGKVVSDKMDKTVNVAVDRWKIVPKYRKRLKYTRKFMAHDELEECKMGDTVMIVPCQKLSRHKHFRVYEIIRTKGQL